jgi:hypothetical protein
VPKQALGQLLIIRGRAEIVRWVAQNIRPLSIVEDPAFHLLMKTGRPDYYIPSRFTVARDVRIVFVNARQRIARILQVIGTVAQISSSIRLTQL